MAGDREERVDPYRLFFELSLDALLLLTRDGKILRANKAACEMFGCTEEELCRNGRDSISDTSDPRLAAALEERDRTGRTRSQLTFIRKDGSKFEGDLTSVLFEGSDGKSQVNVIIRDITPYKQTLRALEKSESKMKSIFLAAPVGVGMVINRVFKEVNSKFCEITGYGMGELIGQNARMIYPSDEEYEHVGHVKYRMIDRYGTGYVETRFKRKSGEIINILMSSTPLDPTDLSIGVTFTALDITERKQAEEALSQSEKRFRNLVEMLPETVFESDMDLNLTFLNRQAYQMFGYSLADFEKGLSVYNMLVPEDGERVREDAANSIQGDMHGLIEYRGLRRDGTEFPILFNTRPILSEGNVTGLRGIIIDVTDNKKLENQLRQSQKMESIGRLAGGVAHEYNNMLGVILGNTELAIEQVPKSNGIYHNLVEIKGAAERSAELTQQLLAFARKQYSSPRILDLNKTIDEVTELLKGIVIGNNVQLERETDTGLWQVKADPSQIGQILSNLFLNAREAGSNRITLKTDNINSDWTFCRRHPGMSPGEYVQISVADNGCGIDRETQGKIFEPFYTTKDISKGGGMGLSTVYGIVKQNNGFIYVSGEKNKGTSVRIFLPRFPG